MRKSRQKTKYSDLEYFSLLTAMASLYTVANSLIYDPTKELKNYPKHISNGSSPIASTYVTVKRLDHRQRVSTDAVEKMSMI